MKSQELVGGGARGKTNVTLTFKIKSLQGGYWVVLIGS